MPFAIAASKLSEVVDQVKLETEYKEVRYKQDNAASIEDKLLDDLAEEVDTCGKAVNGSIRDFYNTTFRKLIKRHFFANAPDFPADFRLLHDLTEGERVQLQTLLITCGSRSGSSSSACILSTIRFATSWSR